MQIGDFVAYNSYGECEIGRIKEIRGDDIFVVYHCDGMWDKFRDYTAALTKRSQLVLTTDPRKMSDDKLRTLSDMFNGIPEGGLT